MPDPINGRDLLALRAALARAQHGGVSGDTALILRQVPALLADRDRLAAEAERLRDQLYQAHPAHMTPNVLGQRLCGCDQRWPCPVLNAEQLESVETHIRQALTGIDFAVDDLTVDELVQRLMRGMPGARAARALREREGDGSAGRCPTCESPDPRHHPALGPDGGEVYQLCQDAFHGRKEEVPDAR